jgi:hypothetical protein
MLRSKYLLTFSVTLLGVLAFALSSCGGGGGGEPAGPPFIIAELISFPAGSVPPGFTNNASVVVLDDSSGASISSAAVTMNGVALAYNPDNEDYEGNVVVAPGGAVSLSVTTGAGTFTASAAQFTSYPSLTSPATATSWSSAAANTVMWSGGVPAANGFYVVGILDAGDPTNTPLVWPIDHFFQQVSIGTTSQLIPADSITAGDRLLVVGIASPGVPISGAAAGSVLAVGGFNYVPLTVTGQPVTSRRSGTKDFLNAVAWSGTQFAAVGGIPGSSVTILTSPEGITWTPRNSGISPLNVLNAIASSGTQFVVVGSSNVFNAPAPILTSPDGISWTPRVSGTMGGLTGVVWSGTQFVAVGSMPSVSDTILTSPDGITWTSRAPGTNKSLSAVTWSGSQFVAVGGNGQILTSPDGAIWTPQDSGSPSFSFRGVAWSGALFVAVGTNFAPCCGDAIVTSPDGVTWTPRSSGTTAFPVAVISQIAQFMAVGFASGTGGTIITSPDGATWTRRASGAGAILAGIATSPTRVVIVGGDGTILTSP